ncbi:helix-turn-helix domain-containing protein [Streptomyces sp. CBMA123]|uniref:helix-turn-helix domain-containing protein n=1 Tax=Streptomyces sp. CBMA123 TaxID=1896313 RepID=UPI001661B98A
MGRREKQITECGRSLQALASWLRAQRETAGLSYARLAERTAFSDDTLIRAASGASIPKLMVVREFAEACGADAAEAERLWKWARHEGHTVSASEGRAAVHINTVANFADLHAALRDLYSRDGCRPYRELSERAGGHGRLPCATVSRVLNRRSLPSREFLLTFVQVCGVRGATLVAWEKAWDRADRDRRPSRRSRSVSARPWPERPRPPKEADLWLEDTRDMRFRPTGGEGIWTSTVAVAREHQRAAVRTRPGVPCMGCGDLISTCSDIAAQWKGHVWCLSCGHDLQLTPALLHRARPEQGGRIRLGSEADGGEDT